MANNLTLKKILILMFLILGMSSVLLTLETNLDIVNFEVVCFSLKRTCSRYK
jgi:hypothetical protein